MKAKRHILDSERWTVEILARYGFSYRLIARYALGSESEHTRIGWILHKAELRVSDYRNGKTEEAKMVLHDVVKVTLPKKKQKKRRKAG